MSEELNQMTKDLMKFKTVDSKDDEFRRIFQYIEGYFAGTGLEVFEHEHNGYRTMVFATDEDPDIMLHGHVDVVDAEDEMFNPEEDEDCIYGRGSADMKSGLSCLMKAVKETTGLGVSVGLMIVSDEEIGGFNGAQHLIKEGKYTPEFALTAEPDSSEGEIEIVTHQKGIMRIVIEAEGESAHGSKPWEGENAAENLWKKYGELKENFDISEDKWTTTVNLGYFEAEGAMNVVPDNAEAGLDVRYTDEYTPEAIVQDLEEIDKLKFKVEAEDPPLKTDREGERVRKLKEIAEEIVGSDFSRKTAASDMRHFSEKGIQAVALGPEGYNIHGENEYVVKESMDKFYRVVKEFIESEA